MYRRCRQIKKNLHKCNQKPAHARQLIAIQKIESSNWKIFKIQFRLVYREALQAHGNTVENTIVLLENHLDNAIYRL